MLKDSNKKKHIQHHLILENDAGFTLMELMIAVAVFTIGLLASIGLASSNYINSQDNLDQMRAINLSREGIELIRNVRDSNWLKIKANEEVSPGGAFDPYTWDEYLSVANGGYIYMSYNNSFPSEFVCASGSLDTCLATCIDCQLYQDDITGYYSHDSSNATATKYYRGFKLNKICLDEGTFNETLTNTNNSCSGIHIGFRVVSRVEWQDNGTKYVEVTNKIYNWNR